MKDEIKYKTAGGNTVTWKRNPHHDDGWGSYECGGCGETRDSFLEKADQHAQNCRAL
ncbi:hypothetical protein ACWEPC_01920 [Nonomuraea sp. NPDC004297]